jgi:molecular chaperone DnaK
VITVPAYFNDTQRQATRNAGRIAGLDVKRILNEPTAAALAYGFDEAYNQTILVFDLGGGTFDVSILDVGDGVFEVRSTAGDTQLGGADFDQKIVTWLAEEFLEQEGIELRKDRQALQRLTEAAEKAKIELSGVATTEISLPFITATKDGPKHIETRLSRSEFEGLCGDLISRLRGPLKQAISDANLSPNDIDEVVLVGGGSRMPMAQDLVRSLIGLEPSQNLNPDEAVAVGAAIQAGILTQEVQDIMLLDVTSLSLGLETIGGVMKKVIPRNTTIPVRRSDIFSTSENNQTSVEVHVLQGEREMGVDNKSLGRFKLMGIPPAPRGVPQVLVSFDIDANGILQVSAMDKTTGREQSLTVQGAANLDESEVQRMIQEAEEYAETDRLQRERVEKRNRAEALTFQAERLLREVALDFGMQFARERRRRIEALVQELRDGLERGNERGIDIAQTELQDELYDLNREAYLYEAEDGQEGGILGQIGNTLKKTFAFDDDLDARPNYGYQGGSWGNWDDDWDYDSRRRGGQSYGQPPSYGQPSNYGQPPSYGGNRPTYGGAAYDTYPNSGYGRPVYDNRPADNRPVDKRPSYDNRPANSRPADNRPVDNRPVDNRPADNRPGINDNPGYGRRGYQDARHGEDSSYDNRLADPSYGNQGTDSAYDNRSYENRPYDDSANRPPAPREDRFSPRPAADYGFGAADSGSMTGQRPPANGASPSRPAPSSSGTSNWDDDPWADTSSSERRPSPPASDGRKSPRRPSPPPASDYGSDWASRDEWL